MHFVNYAYGSIIMELLNETNHSLRSFDKLKAHVYANINRLINLIK